MRDFNDVCITGRLTKDVQCTMTQTQKKYCMFTLAVGRDKDNSDFINVIAWEGLAETISMYCSKGQRIGIRGALRSRSYDKNGQKVYVTEVLADSLVFLEKKETSSPNQRPVQNQKPVEDKDPFYNSNSNNGALNIAPDDLPFY